MIDCPVYGLSDSTSAQATNAKIRSKGKNQSNGDYHDNGWLMYLRHLSDISTFYITRDSKDRTLIRYTNIITMYAQESKPQERIPPEDWRFSLTLGCYVNSVSGEQLRGFPTQSHLPRDYM